MAKVAVVYFSGSGHTAKMADAVAKGAGSVAGAAVKLVEIKGADIKDGRWKNDAVLAELDAADAIVFGTPTYMGGPAAQFKAFADATSERWFGRKWVNKIGAAFTVSGGPSGDKLSTLLYLFVLAMQHGMVWVGQSEIAFNDKGINRLSFHSGAAGQAFMEPPEEAPNAQDKLTGEVFGKRVAELAARWLKGR
jgi:NAD(P)H dehydrogenase (quinone)